MSDQNTANWRERAERERSEKAQRLHSDARRRLRRMEQAALAPLAFNGTAVASTEIILDSERYAAPLLDRLGARGRIQMLLWSVAIIFCACAIVSFFTAPLMSVDLAVESTLVWLMLVLSYIV
jgi:hypothetical protein